MKLKKRFFLAVVLLFAIWTAVQIHTTLRNRSGSIASETALSAYKEAETTSESSEETSAWLDDTYPESLRELYQKNPETKQFVQHYFDEKDITHNMDLSDDVTPGEIPLLLQWDERWGYETYGSDLLAITGCGPTCLSMVACYLTGDTSLNPYAVAKMAEENGYYVEGSGSSWSLMTTGAQLLGLSAQELSLNADSICSQLAQGCPIICIMGPGDFTDTGHFIVLSGLADDGSIQIRDPNSIIRSEETWDIQRLMQQIQGLWSYRCL